LFFSIILVKVKLLMAVNPRGRLKLIVITSIAVLFLSGANFGNAQTMDKIVDCDASFSKHFGKYGYKSGEGEFKDFLGEYYCSWELKSLDTNSAYSHEADARIFPVFSANIFLRTSDDCELGCTLFRAYIDDRVVDEWTDLENVFGGKLIIRYDRPKPEQAGNSGLELRVETGKCRVSLNGRAGIGNWGSAGLEPSYSSFHYNDPDDVTNHINEHPESDHGLSTAKKEILKTAGQLMADLEPLCGGTTLIQPSVAEKISTPEEQEIKGTTYNNFREYYDRLFTVVDNILYRVPVPDIPENTTYEQCQEICGDYGRNTLVDACQNSDTLKGLEAEFLVRGLRNLGSVTSCKSISYIQFGIRTLATKFVNISFGVDQPRHFLGLLFISSTIS